MALIKSLRGFTPQFGKECFLAENATLVGDIIMGDYCSVWFGTVIRGDVNPIRIGHRVNIQDGTIIHGSYGDIPTWIGDNVSIGHRAIVHGCRLEDNVLVGMGAIVLDGAVVASNSIIAAGAVVLENTQVESNSIYAGIPARKVKTLSEAQRKDFIDYTAEHYVKYSKWYREAQ